jgi:outer membrane protein assembly factor BamD
LKVRNLVVIVVLALAATACHRGPRIIRPRVDPELLKMSKEQIFQKAEDQFAREKWAKARTYYQHVYENYPNDPLGRRSLLRVADTYFKQGDPLNYVEAQYKYRDFINRYPGSEQADYAMLQIAMCAYKQMEKPDRDQAKTRETVEKINDMLRAYPKSRLRPEAEARLQDANDRLAKHEHIIAKFYMKRGSYGSALIRLNFLIEKFPAYATRDEAFFDLGTTLAALGRNGEARLYFERLVAEYPNSEYAERAKRRLDTIKA